MGVLGDFKTCISSNSEHIIHEINTRLTLLHLFKEYLKYKNMPNSIHI